MSNPVVKFLPLSDVPAPQSVVRETRLHTGEENVVFGTFQPVGAVQRRQSAVNVTKLLTGVPGRDTRVWRNRRMVLAGPDSAASPMVWIVTWSPTRYWIPLATGSSSPEVPAISRVRSWDEP